MNRRQLDRFGGSLALPGKRRHEYQPSIRPEENGTG
jgi:hypothetical protein